MVDKKEQEDDQRRFKELEEVNDNLQNSRRQKVSVESKLRSTAIFKRKAELTKEELKQMDQKMITYKAVGRMFIKTPIDKLQESLSKKINDCASNIESLTKKGVYLDNEIKSKEQSLKELQQEHLSIVKARKESSTSEAKSSIS